MTRFDLTGLKADNLVAFMAALGTLRTCSLIHAERTPKLAWTLTGRSWSATLQLDGAISQDDLIGSLHEYLRTPASAPALHIADNLTVAVEDFQAALMASYAHARLDNRAAVDFLAAFGSDAVQSQVAGKPSGRIADTAFRTMSGAGHQHFLGTMRTIIADTTAQHLLAALFAPWDYSDPLQNHSLRWDPQDDVRYALQWTEPSKDNDRKKTGSMWGAYRLAIEALPLFTTAPQAGRLVTTGFTEDRRRTELTWPIWDPFIDLPAVHSLIALSALQRSVPDRQELARRGIRELFRCRRITEGKFRNFTAAQPA